MPQALGPASHLVVGQDVGATSRKVRAPLRLAGGHVGDAKSQGPQGKEGLGSCRGVGAAPGVSGAQTPAPEARLRCRGGGSGTSPLGSPLRSLGPTRGPSPARRLRPRGSEPSSPATCHLPAGKGQAPSPRPLCLGLRGEAERGAGGAGPRGLKDPGPADPKPHHGVWPCGFLAGDTGGDCTRKARLTGRPCLRSAAEEAGGRGHAEPEAAARCCCVRDREGDTPMAGTRALGTDDRARGCILGTPSCGGARLLPTLPLAPSPVNPPRPVPPVPVSTAIPAAVAPSGLHLPRVPPPSRAVSGPRPRCRPPRPAM